MSFEKINILQSPVVATSVENIDTDQIIPARFLKATTREGFGDAMFRDWRFNSDGSPVRDSVFATAPAGAKILVNESGSWHVQTTADNSPMNDTPRIPTVIGKTDPHLGAPLYEEVSKHFPNLDHNSPNARKYRAFHLTSI